jgi:TolA-binding protein
MSSDDLEGDDIWGESGGSGGGGDGAGGAGAGGTATSNEAPGAGRGEESKQEADSGDDAQAANEEPLEDEETRHMTISELRQRIHLINNDIRVMKSDVQRITHESKSQRERIKENLEKVKVNKQLPFLVANVVEVLEPDAEDGAYPCPRDCTPSIQCVCVLTLECPLSS